MAKELDIPEDNEASFDIAVNGQIRDSDVIRINNEHICLHLSDIGLNAQLVKHFEEGKVRGKLGYAMVVVKTLWKKTRMEVIIKSGKEEQKHDAVMVVIANATKYGTGAVINPEGSLYDGRFEVVIVKKLDALFKMLLIQRPFNPEKIEVFHATSLLIKTKRKVYFQVDGEYLGKVNRIEGEIMPGQLKLIVP
jgi:diacylglycerol kinase family enzyme